MPQLGGSLPIFYLTANVVSIFIFPLILVRLKRLRMFAY